MADKTRRNIRRSGCPRFPMGEQIPQGLNGRTDPCYAEAALPTQKFTGKERDAETGLDYFGARYFSAPQGRFTSPDQPFLDQDPADPQSWNLFAYGRNNPLRYTDPSGAYVCGSTLTDQQCHDFELARGQAVDLAEQLRAKYGDNSQQYLEAQRSIDAYGEPGIDNGVTVGVANLKGYGGEIDAGSNIGPRTAENPSGKNIQVTLDTKTMNAGGLGLATTIAHEGSHVADASAWISSGFASSQNATVFASEYRAYSVGMNVLGIAGVAPFSMGPPGGPKVFFWPGNATGNEGAQIEKLLAIPTGYNVTRQRPGGRLFYRHTVRRR